ncbi:MAG: UvrD-helicase domain-containing protein [Candidatus Aminicenantes bacterium]|nr:UvrD-helicase domain-containing protein [Candidatus Aminicenantes bacterium]
MTQLPPLVDRAEREKIATELGKTFLVEAGAGSGKTRSLVERMIALLETGTCRIDNIAAVTFTKKAAGELQGRFQTDLEKRILALPEDSEEKRRLAEAIHFLEQIFIGTIHSFCAKLLRERPVEIGLDPEFDEMEEIEDGLFREQCWHEFLAVAKTTKEALIEDLEEAGLSPYDLKRAFDVMSDFPEVRWTEGSDAEPDYEVLRGELEVFLREAEKRVPGEIPEKGYDDLQRLMIRCLIRERNLGFDDPRMLMETYEIMGKKKYGVTQNRWPSKDEAKDFEAYFEKFVDGPVAEALRQWREYRHSKVLDFLEPALAYYRDRRQRLSRLNFQDQLLLASRLLRDKPEVRQYFGRKFTHILVDEFQDTDPIQAEVLFYLAGRDVEERDWKKCVPRPGALFLVGDPKQSIYRFRRADIVTYNLVKDILRKSDGEILRLTTNFRSLHALGEWNNTIFGGVLPEEDNPYQARFAELKTRRPGEEGMWGGVYKISVPKIKYDLGAAIAENDARVAGDFIKWACDGNMKLARTERERAEGLGDAAQFSDFLVLFKRKKHMEIYARAMEERGIPYDITGSGTPGEAQEVREVFNLFKALDEPDNPIYVTAVLRGLFFGVSDEELWRYKLVWGRFFIWGAGDGGGAGEGHASLGDGGEAEEGISSTIDLNDPGAEKVRAAISKLREWFLWTRMFPASSVLEMILEDSGMTAYLASSEMGNSRAGNMFKILEVLRVREAEGLTGFGRITEFLDEFVHKHEVEELSLAPGRKNAVRMMNLHKAKGLEAPVVFLANPYVGLSRRTPDRHIVRRGAEPVGYFRAGKSTGPYHSVPVSQPVGWEKKEEEERKYEEAEEARLLYVAATRARNVMVISTYEGGKEGTRAWGFLDGYLEEVEELEDAVRDAEGMARGKTADEEKTEVKVDGKTEDKVEGKAGGEAKDKTGDKTGGDERRLGTGGGSAGRKKLVLAEGEWEAAAMRMKERLDVVRRHGYVVETVTSLAKKGGDFPEWKRGGLGESWGRAVHGLLQAVGREEAAGRDIWSWEEDDLFLLAENLLAAEERDVGEGRRLIELAAAVTQSELWERMKHAERRYFEIPFSVKVEEDGGGSRDIILSGVIDLIFREKDGWVIADYKTDDVGYNVQSFVNFYTPQVRIYTRFWEEITGEKVKEAGLYFTSLQRWVKVV